MVRLEYERIHAPNLTDLAEKSLVVMEVAQLVSAVDLFDEVEIGW